MTVLLQSLNSLPFYLKSADNHTNRTQEIDDFKRKTSERYILLIHVDT